jgi:hypothetical protein
VDPDKDRIRALAQVMRVYDEVKFRDQVKKQEASEIVNSKIMKLVN